MLFQGNKGGGDRMNDDLSRRGFLGSVIGLWASTSFLARTIKDSPQIVEASLEDYQLLFHDLKSGHTLRVPGIKDLQSSYEKWEFICHPLKVTREMEMDLAILVSKRGLVLSQSRLLRTLKVRDPDTVSFVYSLVNPGSGTDDLAEAIASAKDIVIGDRRESTE